MRDLVIPAKAGIYSANPWKCAVVGLDSRFRGNDQGFRGNDRRIERIPIPNDTRTKDCTRACIHVDAFVIFADSTLYPSLTGMSNFDQTCEQYGADTRMTPSYKRRAPSCQPGAAERRMSSGEEQHALDNFRDSGNPVVAGLCLSRWRRPHPHIARGCSDLVAMEPAHRSQICFVRRPNRPNLRGRQDLTLLLLLLFRACWPSL